MNIKFMFNTRTLEESQLKERLMVSMDLWFEVLEVFGLICTFLGWSIPRDDLDPSSKCPNKRDNHSLGINNLWKQNADAHSLM